MLLTFTLEIKRDNWILDSETAEGIVGPNDEPEDACKRMTRDFVEPTDVDYGSRHIHQIAGRARDLSPYPEGWVPKGDWPACPLHFAFTMQGNWECIL